MIKNKCKKIVAAMLLMTMIATMFSTNVFAGGSSSTPNDYLICGSCGKGVTYEFNTFTKELKILGRGEIKDFKGFGNACPSNGVTVTKNVVNIAATSLSIAGGRAITNKNLTPRMKTGIDLGVSIGGYVVGQLVGFGIDAIKNKVDISGTVPWREYMLDIKYVTVTDGITKIGKNAFANLENLKDVKIANSVEEIDMAAFVNCTSLTSVTIGNGVKQIGDYAFCGCDNLTNVTYNGKSNLHNSDAFVMCSLLQEVKVLPYYEGNTFCGIKITKG